MSSGLAWTFVRRLNYFNFFSVIQQLTDSFISSCWEEQMIWNFVPTVKKVVRLTVLLYLKDGTLAPYFAKTASDCRNALRLCGVKPFEHNSSWSARNHSCLDWSSVDLSIFFLGLLGLFDMPWRCCLKVCDPCEELQLHSVAPMASTILSKSNGSDIWPQDCLNFR